MALTSIKKNFAYKSILNLSSYLAGFITFAYTAHIACISGFVLTWLKNA